MQRSSRGFQLLSGLSLIWSLEIIYEEPLPGYIVYGLPVIWRRNQERARHITTLPHKTSEALSVHRICEEKNVYFIYNAMWWVKGGLSWDFANVQGRPFSVMLSTLITGSFAMLDSLVWSAVHQRPSSHIHEMTLSLDRRPGFAVRLRKDEIETIVVSHCKNW